MRLALDATYSIGDNLTGVGVYCREMLRGAAALAYPEPVSFLYRQHRLLRAFREKPPENARRGLLLETLGPRNRLFHGLLDRGVYIAPALYEAGFVSAAHTQEDIAETVAIARDVFRSL